MTISQESRQAPPGNCQEAADLQTRIQLQEQTRTYPYAWHRWFFDRLQLPAAGRVLDLGAGPGTLWLRNGERVPSTWQVTLADASPCMLQAARRDLPGISMAAAITLADAQALPFADGTLAGVIGDGLFDHLEKRERAFAEVRRVLEAGGRLYAAAGSQRHLREMEEMVRPFVSQADYGGDAGAFGLESGMAQLQRWFARVIPYRYVDTLVFQSVELLVAYLVSEEAVRVRLDPSKLAGLRRSVARRLATTGQIRVTEEKVVFEAIKA